MAKVICIFTGQQIKRPARLARTQAGVPAKVANYTGGSSLLSTDFEPIGLVSARIVERLR
jgi:hypothetical protein